MVLLGSSQILLLKQVRESLAGRISIFELFPLMMAEIGAKEDKTPKAPLLHDLLANPNPGDSLSSLPEVLFDKEEAEKRNAQEYLLRWGGMPALINLPESERDQWIKDYTYTYLERDLADLARISDLYPFSTLQKIAALRTAQLINFAELARDAALHTDRTRRYLEYLKLSYQVFFVPPYYENLTKRLVKTPKLYWLRSRHLETFNRLHRRSEWPSI